MGVSCSLPIKGNGCVHIMGDIDRGAMGGVCWIRFQSPGLIAALLVAAWFGGSVFQSAAAAEFFPQRPIRLIVPFPPGGAGDILGRMLSPKLGEALGQQIVIDNRGGGAQVIATQLTAKAPADGYTVLLASTTHGINPGLQKNLPYDSIKDFTPITQIAESPIIFVAHPSLGVSNMQELVALAKSRPGRINYASPGAGTGGHMAVELLKWMAGIDITHVPYKGSGPALTEVIAGHVPVMAVSPLPVLPHLRSGRLRGLATTGRVRTRVAPELPTVAESGVPGYQASLWYALLGPAGIPQPIIYRLHTETSKVLKLSDMAKQLLAQGAEPVGNSPQELATFLRAEIDRWTRLIQETNIRAD